MFKNVSEDEQWVKVVISVSFSEVWKMHRRIFSGSVLKSIPWFSQTCWELDLTEPGSTRNIQTFQLFVLINRKKICFFKAFLLHVFHFVQEHFPGLPNWSLEHFPGSTGYEGPIVKHQSNKTWIYRQTLRIFPGPENFRLIPVSSPSSSQT